MDTQLLKKLKSEMPKGYRDLLAQKFEVSVAYVDMIFNGKRQNLKILKFALKIAKNIRETRNNITAEINNL